MLNQQWHSRRAAILIFSISIFLVLLVRYFQKGWSQSASFPAPVIAEIQGDIKRPGVYTLDGPSATVANGLTAAEGLLQGRLSDVPQNLLSRQVHSGQLIRITSQNCAVQIQIEDMSAAVRLALGEKLDLNKSSEEELCFIPKMKPEFARAIAARRSKKPWQSIQDLSELPGVGPKTIEKWKNYLIVGERQ